MDNVLIATVDENWNQFETVDGVFKFISSVPEFNSIVEHDSAESLVFTDYDGYAALGYKNYPLRSTRVFLKSDEELEDDSFCVSSTYEDLSACISQNDNKTIFFMGSPEFVSEVIPHVTRISICVVPNNTYVFPTIKFPIELIKGYFLGRVDIEPKMLESINKLKELGGLSEDDKLYACPSNYMFHDYSRSRNVPIGGGSYLLKSKVIDFLSKHQPPQTITTVFQNETLSVACDLCRYYGYGEFQWTVKLTIQEKLTRFKKGDNFSNDKTDIVSFIEGSVNLVDFKYKSTNGMANIEDASKFEEVLMSLENKHVVGDDIWDIKL